MKFKLFYTDVVSIPFPVSYSTFLGHFHSKVSILMAVAVVAWQSTPGLPHWEECDDDVDCSSLYNPLGVNPLAS